MDAEQGIAKLVLAYQSQLTFLLFSSPHSQQVEVALDPAISPLQPALGANKFFVFAPFNPETSGYQALLDYTFSFRLPSVTYPGTDHSLPQDNKHQYLKTIKNVLGEIEKGVLNKVVISRSQQVPLKAFDLKELIVRLFAQDDRIFRYIWFHPSTGIWAGATPETLLEVRGTKIATMSLAGTRRTSDTQSWSDKEFAEQAHVTTYLKDRLEGVLESVKIKGPYDQQAGELVHLRTDISGELRGPMELSSILLAIHPTPAVCGTPLAPALAVIQKEEGYERAFYTGYLGVVNQEQRSAALYVNLRCMSIEQGVATIYTGGGITVDSSPEDEWNETCHKQRTMLKVLSPFL
jgi:isochorismate synthase